uniref:Succinate dehydrogenase cytochrome b560 subunit, mitochondrial n=1 Tax=Globodera pallida TaxID=36090 RepID=A0A183C244_GLOPA
MKLNRSIQLEMAILSIIASHSSTTIFPCIRFLVPNNARKLSVYSARMRFVRFCSHATKTPVQEFGYEYVKRQMNMGRPVSPHLTIYKPQLTWLMSGAHRIVGCVMSAVLLMGGVAFAILPVDFTSIMERLHSLNLWRPVTNSLKFLIAFPIVYHTLNGIRFMGFDMAKAIELPTIYRSGYLVIALSTLISLLIVANSTHLNKEQFQAKFKDVKGP